MALARPPIEDQQQVEQPFAARWAALAIAGAWIAIASFIPQLPSVAPADADAGQFSAVRARRHLEVIAAAPRPVGSARHRQVRQYLVDELARLGFAVQVQAATSAARTDDHTVTAAAVHNVLATRAGTRAGAPAVLLVAHYDSVPGSPGAGDDGAALASILEVARALRTGPVPANDLWILFTDAEEQGLLGARAWLKQPGLARRIGVVLNFEARGTHGPSLLFETGAQAGRLTRWFGQAAPHAVGSSLYAEVYRHMPNDTDFTVFREAGVPGLNFAFIDGFLRYHSTGDDLAHADPRTLQHQGETLLAVARRLADADLGDLREPDAVYFNPAGSWLLHYSTAAARGGLALACVLVLALLTIAIRRGAMRASTIARMAAIFLAAAVAAAVAVTGAWMAIRAWVPAYRAFPQHDTWDSPLHALALGAIATAITLALAGWSARRARTAELAAAATLVWLLPAVATAIAFPGASYLFAWPLAAGLITTALLVRADRAACPLPLLALAAGPAILVVLPAVRDLHTALGLDAAAIPAVLLALTAAVLMPLVVGLTGRRLVMVASTLALTAVLVIAGAAATFRFDARHPRFASLFRTVEAGVLPPPELQVIADTRAADLRTLVVRPRSARGAPRVDVELGAGVRGGSIAGVALAPGTRVECWSSDDLPLELTLETNGSAELRLSDRSFETPTGSPDRVSIPYGFGETDGIAVGKTISP